VPPESTVEAIAHVIQLAVAPVFLLTGVSSMLNVLTGRMARIIDRARALEQRLGQVDEAQAIRLHTELNRLSHRARVVNLALSLCTTCALLVCAVIAVLFLGALLSVDASGLIAATFIAAMFAFMAGLIGFLREVYLATAGLRFGPE
jgi:hypothetical protein